MGQRVGVGWHAWHCLSCDNCRRGDFFACQTEQKVTGISFDGGYADYMIAPATALAVVPAELPGVGHCAADVRGSSRRLTRCGIAVQEPEYFVAVLGIGGLGHLGVQYAAQNGFPHGCHCPREGQRGAGARQLGT